MSDWRGPVSFTLSDDGIITSWSPGIRTALGYEAEGFVGRPFAELYPEAAQVVGLPERVLGRARDLGRAALAGWKLAADGTSRFLVGGVDAQRSSQERSDGFVVSFTAELEFGRPNPARPGGPGPGRPDPGLYVEALEGMNDIFFVVDASFRFVYVNASAEDAWNLRRKDVLGKAIWEVFPHALDSEALAQQVRVMDLGLPVRFETYSPALARQVQFKAFPRRSGGLAIVIRDLSASGRDATPSDDHVVSVSSLAEAYDSLGVAVFDWRPSSHGWTISGPVAEVFGLKAGGEVAGPTGLRALMLPADAKLHDLVVEAGLRQQTGWHHEYRILRPRDNKVAWLEEHVRVESADDGPRYVGMVWDISVVKAAEERLGSSQRMLRDELRSNRRLQEYLARAMDAGDPQLALGHIVEAAVDLLGADRGTVRLLDRETGTVTIKAQCGFDADYLATHGVMAVDVGEFERQALGEEDEGEGRRARLTSVPDGRRAAAQERWSPLFEIGGKLLGVLSLQWEQPRELSEREEFDLNTLVHQAGTIAEVLVSLERAHELHQRLRQSVSVDVDELAQAEIRFRRVFEVGLLAAVITTQDEDRFLEVNGGYTQLTGYEAAEVVGRTAAELGMWSSREDKEKLQAAFQTSGDFRELELRLRRKDGGIRNILLSGSKIVYQGKQAWLKMFNDVTEHQRSREELMTAIRAVMADADWFSQSVVERLTEIQSASHGREGIDVDLSQRERQVLERVAVGMPDERIARDLGISVKTVRNHLSNAYAKIDVHNRAEAVVWARDRGIVLAT